MKDKSKTIDPIKKAKRRKFWFGFLRVVLIIAVVIAVMKLVDVLVEKTIKNADPSYFVFSNGEDNLQHVTADFKVPLKLKSKNGKYHKVKWTENSPYASIDKEGNVSIKLPEEKNVKLVLWENYGWFIFKGKRQYVLDLVTSNVQQFGNEADIPVDKVINGTYHRDMDIAFDGEDNVAYVFGDFGDTKLYNEGDIVAYIEHNRETLNIPDELEIKVNSYSTSKTINTCNFDLYYDGVRIDDDIIVVATSNEDYKPKKVTCDITRDFSILNENIDIDMEACKEALEAKYEISPLNVRELETVIVDNRYCSVVSVDKDGYMAFEVCIDKNNFEVLYDNIDNMSLFNPDNIINNLVTNSVSTQKDSVSVNNLDSYQDAFPELETIILKGQDEHGKKIEMEGCTDGKYTYMYDLKRNIKVYQLMDEDKNPLIDENNPIDVFVKNKSYLYNHNNSEAEDFFESFAFSFVKFKYDPILVNSKDDNLDYSYKVESEIFHNVQSAYDDYYKTYGWHSYNNNGDGFNIYTNVYEIEILKEEKKFGYDNLAWNYNFNCIYAGKREGYLTSPAVDPVAITHEFSHGVLHSKIPNSVSSIDGKALHEAFGDVMGICLNHDKTWEVGKVQASDIYLAIHPDTGKNRDLCIRDLKDPNGGRRYEILKKKAPEYYEDSIYKDKSGAVDEHDRGLLLGNIAYKMHVSGEFTQDEIADLWYMAVSFGFDSKVSLPRFRTNLLEAIEMTCKERKTQKIELVEKLFDEKHIYDESYYSLYNTNSRIIKDIKSARNDSVVGDPIKDDTVVNSYYIFYSPITFLLNKTNVYIIESVSSDMPKTDKTQKEIQEMIENNINNHSQLKRDHKDILEAKRDLLQVWFALKSIFSNDDGSANTDVSSEIKVVYLRVPRVVMSVIQQKNQETGEQVKESLLDLVTDDPDSTFWNKVVNFVWRLMFHDEYYETTAYDFYNSL